MTPRQKKKAGAAASFLIKTIIGLLFISPLIIGVCFSIQTDQDLMTYPLRLITSSPTLQSYFEVFHQIPIMHYLKNSAIVCLICIIAQIVFSCLAAYGFVCFDFPFKKQLFTLVLMTTMIPGEVVVITNYVTIQNMNLIMGLPETTGLMMPPMYP